MWNETKTDAFGEIRAYVETIKGHNGDSINAYIARPVGGAAKGGVVLVHHMPGWDEFYRETARRFADHGYIVISPNLYERFGHGAPPDIAAKVRSEGGVPDEDVVGDLQASLEYLKADSECNGKVGIIGTCSGGRHSYLAACKVQGFSALVDCWGGNVIMPSDRLTTQQPVSPHEYTADLSCPVLGLFGNEDQNPPPEQVDQLEEELKKHGKSYEFHRYDDAGHGFWYYDRPAYRQEQAIDSWNKMLAFFERNLQ